MNDSLTFRFLQSVENALDRLIAPYPLPRSVLVACSGGPDSVVLLDVLCRLRASSGLEIRVCHVHHGLRGKEADEDEALVIRLAERYDVPLTVRRFNSDEVDEIKQNNLEESARQLRYQKLEHSAVELDCMFIATGHTRSDQAETVLHRILRSTGLSGLSGILPMRTDLLVPVIRPLLEVGRDQVLQYASENHLVFRHDAMNDDLQYTRVRIRNRLLPWLKKEFNPQMEDSLSHLSRLARDDEMYWASHMESLQEEIGEATMENPADRVRFLSLFQSEQTRLIRFYCKKRGLDPSWQQIENALSVLAGERKQAEIQLQETQYLYRRYDQFYFALPSPLQNIDQEFSIPIPGRTDIPELGIRVTCEWVSAHVHLIRPQGILTELFDADKVREPVIIRTRRDGDVIHPLGMDGSKKVKKIFQEKRIPLEERERIPLLIMDREIAWIVGHCVSDRFRVTKATKLVLWISIVSLAESRIEDQ